MDFVNNLPLELINLILSYRFDKRGYEYSHYEKFKLKFRNGPFNIIDELDKYFLNNYWYQREINNNEVIPYNIKINGILKLKSIKKKYKTLNDLKYSEYCDDYIIYKKYY